MPPHPEDEAAEFKSTDPLLAEAPLQTTGDGGGGWAAEAAGRRVDDEAESCLPDGGAYGEGGQKKRTTLACLWLHACAWLATAAAGAATACLLVWRPGHASWHVKGMHQADTCNPAVKPLEFTLSYKGVYAPAFDLPQWWKEKCENEEKPRSLIARPSWPGQNACWDWTKRLGCYEPNSEIDWFEGQSLAASQERAPFPEDVLLEPVKNPHLCMVKENGAPITNSTPDDEEAAKLWLNTHVAVYVVNLPKDTERWISISSRLEAMGLDFARIPGIAIKEPNDLEGAQVAGFVPRDWDVDVAQEAAYSDYQGMGGIMGTVGCAAAHLNAMKIASDNFALSPQKTMALVLEDDIELQPDFPLKLRRMLLNEAPCDWAAISLRSRCPYGACVSPHLTRVLPDGNEPVDRCRHGVNYGFFGMLYQLSTLAEIRSRMMSVVWQDKQPRCLDVDVALASISDKVAYYAVPYMQMPGFLQEGSHGSSRYDTNVQQLRPTTTTTTRTATTTSTTSSSTTAAAAAGPKEFMT